MDVIDGEWIKARLKGRHGERAELARFMGIDQDKLSKILKGVRKVQPDEIPKILQFFKESQPLIPVPNGAPPPPDAQLVPVYDVCASAGFGLLAPEYEAVAYNLAFPPDYLRTITSTRPEHLAIVSVKGDSMAPTLNDGDVVLVDTTKTSLAYEGIFVIRIDDALQVKRIGHSRSGHVFVVSDNSEHYPRREHPRDEITVIGKVLWAGGKVS